MTMTDSDARFFREMIELLPDRAPPRLISEYVQGRRILPPSTPFPGYWDNSRTPYLVEIMDDMSPYSPIQHSVTMKARKLGVTAAAENVCAYWMDANPTAVEYVTATDELAEDWATRRLEPLIDSLGFRHKIAASQNNPKSRRTGDKVFKKQFMGGYLDIISAMSMAARRAGDIRVLVRDEIDGPRATLASGEGKWLEVNYGHTASWGPRKKVMDFSSPTTYEASEINREYELGDCRKFLVPCPFCGRDQELMHLSDEAAHGLKAETEAGRLVRAYYVCEFCHEAIQNYQKTAMLIGGHWEPTKPSQAPEYRSRQISSLYSPVGMLSWTEYMAKYFAAREDPDLMPSFTNLYLGLPYREQGSRPDVRKVIALRGTYPKGQVQPGVIYLTAAVDVQRGSEKDPDSPPRLEMEVLGHGRGYRTWSVDYRVFPGPIGDPYAGAWEELHQWASEGGLLYPRADGAQFTPAIVFVDSSDGNVTNIVYGFCGRWRSTYPCKGAKVIVADPKKREVGDVPGSSYKRWRELPIGDADQRLYEVNTQFYKQALYRKLNTIPRQPTEPQPAGFCDFPRDYEDEYFTQLAAEEMRADGTFHKVRARNEALDCRVYAMCAADVYLMGVIEGLRRRAREQGATLKACEEIKSPHALTWLEQRIIVPQ